MKLSEGKTQAVIFRNMGAVIPTEKFHLLAGNRRVEVVPHYKFLGIVMDQHLTMREHCEALGKKARQRLGAWHAKGSRIWR
jgi:hypothetical protein